MPRQRLVERQCACRQFQAVRHDQVRDVLERSAEADAPVPSVYPSVAEAVAALQADAPAAPS